MFTSACLALHVVDDGAGLEQGSDLVDRLSFISRFILNVFRKPDLMHPIRCTRNTTHCVTNNTTKR